MSELVLLDSTTTLLSACEALNRASARVAFIVNDSNSIIKSLSYGDISRALLRGVSIHSNCSGIGNPSFVYLEESDQMNARLLMKKHGITDIPIVNPQLKPIRLVSYQDLL